MRVLFLFCMFTHFVSTNEGTNRERLLMFGCRIQHYLPARNAKDHACTSKRGSERVIAHHLVHSSRIGENGNLERGRPKYIFLSQNISKKQIQKEKDFVCLTLKNQKKKKKIMIQLNQSLFYLHCVRGIKVNKKLKNFED